MYRDPKGRAIVATAYRKQVFQTKFVNQVSGVTIWIEQNRIPGILARRGAEKILQPGRGHLRLVQVREVTATMR